LSQTKAGTVASNLKKRANFRAKPASTEEFSSGQINELNKVSHKSSGAEFGFLMTRVLDEGCGVECDKLQKILKEDFE